MGFLTKWTLVGHIVVGLSLLGNAESMSDTPSSFVLLSPPPASR
jgi:hypothetical protein